MFCVKAAALTSSLEQVKDTATRPEEHFPEFEELEMPKIHKRSLKTITLPSLLTPSIP